MMGYRDGGEGAGFAKFLPQYLVLCSQIVNRISLMAIDPTSQDVDQQVPRMKNEVHGLLDAPLSNRNRQHPVNC